MAGMIMPIISGLAGLFGGGQQQKVSTTNQNQSTTSNNATANAQTAGSTTGSTNPILSALQKQLSGAAGANALNANAQATDMTGYTQQGLQNVNSQNSDQVLQNILAQKGQTYSPAGTTAETQNQLNRVNQGNQFLAGVPLLQTQMKQQALGGLNQTFAALPTATQSAGTTAGTSSGTTTGGSTTSGTSSGTQTTTGNPIAGALGGAGAALAAPGMNLQGGQTGQSNLGSILGMLGF